MTAPLTREQIENWRKVWLMTTYPQGVPEFDQARAELNALCDAALRSTEAAPGADAELVRLVTPIMQGSGISLSGEQAERIAAALSRPRAAVSLDVIIAAIEHEAEGWRKQNDDVIANAVSALIPTIKALRLASPEAPAAPFKLPIRWAKYSDVEPNFFHDADDKSIDEHDLVSYVNATGRGK